MTCYYAMLVETMQSAKWIVNVAVEHSQKKSGYHEHSGKYEIWIADGSASYGKEGYREVSGCWAYLTVKCVDAKSLMKTIRYGEGRDMCEVSTIKWIFR